MKTVAVFVAVVLLALVALVVSTRPVYDPNGLDSLFDQWQSQHHVVFKDDETKEKRKKAFKKNADEVNKLNADSAQDPDGAQYSLDGPHADLTHEEFMQLRAVKLVPDSIKRSDEEVEESEETETAEELAMIAALPTRVDWRKKGKVSKVKNQKQCGSCWAFSTTGAIESAWAIKKKSRPPLLSEQQLVDCTPNTGPCAGQWMGAAVDYIKKAGGIHKSRAYPYRAKEGKCRRFSGSIGARVQGYTHLEKKYTTIMRQVATKGPVMAIVDSTHLAHYRSGVITKRGCGQDANHAVLIVGYGKSPKGVPYWIVKNSWGTTWGSKGYFLIKRGKSNECGINNWVLAVTV